MDTKDADAEPAEELVAVFCVTLAGTIFTAGPMVDAAILVQPAEISSRDIRMQLLSSTRWAVVLRTVQLAMLHRQWDGRHQL